MCTACAASSIQIQQPFTDTLWCSGGSAVGIHYTVTTVFASGNVFTVQLSNASGNFNSGQVIGFLTATGSGTIICYPSGIPAGNGYRIRVIGSMPADTSQDNGVNIHIGVFPPAPVISNNSPQCVGGHVTLAVTNLWPNTRYYWAGPGFNGYAKQVDFNSVDFAKAGGYNISALDTSTPAQCVTIGTTVVVVKPLPEKPTASILTPTPACEGDSVVLFANAISIAPEFEWHGPNGFIAGQPPNVTLNPISVAQKGWYVAYGKLQGCLSSGGDSIWLEVINKPHLTLASNSPICAGNDLRLGAHDTGSISYSWQGPNGFQSVFPDIVIPNATTNYNGNYIITAVNQSCVAKDTIPVEVRTLPAKIKISSNSPVCEGDDLKIILPVVGLPGNTSFAIAGPNGFEAFSDTTIIKNVSLAAAGNYITITRADGCTSTDTASVIVKPAPDIKAWSNSPVQEDGQLKLFAESSTKGTTFIWQGPGDFGSTGQNPVIEKASIDNAGIYIVQAAFEGCIATDSVKVDVYEKVKYTLFQMHPNPNNGEFILEGHLKKPQLVYFEICYVNGMVIYKGTIASTGKTVTQKIFLPAHLPNGLYILRVHADGEMQALKFNIVR